MSATNCRSAGAWRATRSGATLAFALVLGAGCTKRDATSPAPPRAPPASILRLSQRNEPGGLDPALAKLPDDFIVLRALSEGLYVRGENGEPQPGAASSCDVSPDGLTYTFHLRPNAKWSNGDPVTARHFLASYHRLLTPATAAPKANVFFPVKNARAFVTGESKDFAEVGFRAPDDHTLVVTLDRPTPRFLHYVASGPWLPVPTRLIEEQGRNWTRPGTYVGNGPFSLVEWRADQRIVLRKNPHWHHASSVRLDEIQFVRFDSGDSEDRGFRTGQVDATMAVPSSKVEAYAAERPAELHRAPMIETRYFTFNTRRPPLNDARVRRALALALDRDAIVQRVLRGGQFAAARLLPPALQHAGLGAPSSAHAFDPAAARQSLAAAGISAKDFPRLEVTAWSPSQSPVLEAAQQMWQRELGLNLAITIHDLRVHLNAVASGDYDIAFVAAIPDVADPAELLGDFVSTATENYPHWADAGFDAAFARALMEGDSAKRAADLLAAEQRLLQEAPVTPVYFNTKIWLMSPRVRGWQEDGLWARCYQNIFLAN